MSLVSSCKVREISQLAIQGLIPRENLAIEKSKCDKIFEEMEINDVVRGNGVMCTIKNNTSYFLIQQL